MAQWGANRGGTASSAPHHRTAVQLRRANEQWSTQRSRAVSGGGDRRPSYDSFMSAVNEEDAYADMGQESAAGPSGYGRESYDLTHQPVG